MYSFEITINGENVSRYACYPFSGELTLDRSLDQAYIELKASPRSKPYPPFSEVVVAPSVGEATTFLIASDEVDTIIKTGLSNHRILLCEETKKLERVICPGKTFVQPLVKNYAQIQEPPQNLTNSATDIRNSALLFPEEVIQKYSLQTSVNASPTYKANATEWAAYEVTPPTLNSIYAGGTALPNMNEIFPSTASNRRLYGYAILVIDHDTQSIVVENKGILNQFGNQTPGITLPTDGRSFDVYYLANFGSTTVLPSYADLYAVGYQISIAPINAQARPQLYITDVTNQLLEIAEPIRQGETPRFTLDEATAKRYATTPCAELNFPNGATLRENLDEIAGIVHCITRLKNGKIIFDKLGEPDYADTVKLGTPVSVRSSANIEKYATHLDSYVDNLMNAQDPKQGAISDPFVGIFRTPRALISNTDARVTVSNCRIDTVFGIEKLEKVEVLYNGNTYDITTFVYEKKEYDLLETNGGVYPYAKAYALYYTQGQRGIDGLTFKQEEATTNAFKNPAIGNILEIVTGQSLHWWEDLFGDDILDYAFNVTYVSAVRGRVRAAKTDVSDVVTPSAMAFNQAAPRLSSVNFGERLTGETAMLSEPETHLCFKTGDLAAVMDAVGKLYPWDEERYYISKVSYKVWSGYIIAEMTLSRNFNQLGRFVSVNNAFRQFEIDDNSQEECIVYEDYAVFTTTTPTSVPNDSLSAGNALLSSINNVIYGANFTNGNHEVTLCRAQTLDADGNELADVLLPVQSITLGNSLLFNFSFKDNYSAGDFLQSQGGYKLARATPYGDPLYGEAKYLAFSLNSDTAYTDTADRISVGDRIPLNAGGQLEYYSEVIAPFSAPLIINKSSRDVPNVTYQLHHVTDSGLIFGAALTARNRLVGYYEQQSSVLLALPFEINPLSPPAPIGYTANGNTVRYTFSVGGVTYNAVKGYRITTNAPSAGVLKIPVINTADTAGGNLATEYKAWAIFRGRDGAAPEFILGANGELKDVYVYLKHNLN